MRDEEKEAMKSHDANDADVIKLNVGGKNFRTSCLIEGSMLVSQFNSAEIRR